MVTLLNCCIVVRVFNNVNNRAITRTTERSCCWNYERRLSSISLSNLLFNLGARTAVFHIRLIAERGNALGIALLRRNEDEACRLHGATIRKKLRVRIKVIQGQKVARRERRLKLLLQKLCVIRPHAKHRHGPYVPKHCILYLLFKLGNELVRHRKRKLVLPRLGENGGHRIRGDVLELVYVEIKRWQRIPRRIHAGKRRHENLPHNDEPQEVRIDVPQTPLREVYQENLLFVHDFSEIEGGLLLRDDRAQEVICHKHIKLARDVGHDVFKRLLAPRFFRDSLQNCAMRGFFACESLSSRNPLSESTREMSKSVLPDAGSSRTRSAAFLKYCSNIGPMDSGTAP